MIVHPNKTHHSERSLRSEESLFAFHDEQNYFLSNSSTAVVIAFTPVRIAGSGNG
jgi:hypothetical protein